MRWNAQLMHVTLACLFARRPNAGLCYPGATLSIGMVSSLKSIYNKYQYDRWRATVDEDGTTCSPSRYDVGACVAPQSPKLRRPAIPSYVSMPSPNMWDDLGSGPTQLATVRCPRRACGGASQRPQYSSCRISRTARLLSILGTLFGRSGGLPWGLSPEL
jgi:hypothetical protein